jgi:enamine deaminase RidA (YjgF/YER057c/UK114 family)
MKALAMIPGIPCPKECAVHPRFACSVALLALFAGGHALADEAVSANGFRYLNPSSLSKPTGYTHVVEVPSGGRTLYLSGQIAFDAQGELVGAGDFARQAEQVFANIDAALKASGASFANVVRLDMYVTDMSQLAALRAARDKYIDTKHPPASTLVQVSRLARDGLLLEVEATAVVPH